MRLAATLRYVAAALPAVATLGSWQLAEWAYEHFGCRTISKGLVPCFAGATDITALVGIGLFWGKLLSWVAVPLSLWLLVRAYERASIQRAEA